MLKKIFNKLKKQKNIELPFTTDIHSHLLPGIDDGVNTIEESIDIIKGLKELGIKKIITTPHIMSHRFPNNKSTIQDAYDVVKKELEKQNISIDIQYASEYYYDDHFLDLIEKKDLLTIGDNYVLFEFSYHIKPTLLEQSVYKLIKYGYKPILAHPERYRYYNSEEHYSRLKDMGLYFQINSISMEGFYGKDVKKNVKKIISLGYVDFIGSDIHNKNYLTSYKKSLNNKIYNIIIDNNIIKNDTL